MPDGIVSWPMYAVDREAVETFWQGLRREMKAAGLGSAPNHLSWPGDLGAHWLSPDLLLSQTCGYPLMTRLAGRVRYVATPCFRAPGCAGAAYSSAVVVREGDRFASIADCAGTRAAFNGRDSQSGYNAFRALVAPHAKAGKFFAQTLETGAHRASIEAVRAGKADVAAIDAVTLALLTTAHPDEVEGLRVLTYTEQAPGLPFVTSRTTSPGDLDRLRRALAAACASLPGREALLLERVEVLPLEAYDVILAMETRARELGYPELA